MEQIALEFSGFSFRHATSESSEPNVGPVDWNVPAGSFALLTGPTGSGKSTLLRQMKPELSDAGDRAGNLRIFGSDPASWSIATSAKTVGFVAQDPENQTVCSSVWHELAFGLENLAIPQDEMRRRIAEVAHFFGIEPWLNRETNALSGGQRQLLVVASALAMRPQLLVLDEPTAQLDPVAEQNLLHALFRTNREAGITVVVATHRPEVMMPYATCAFRLENGHLGEIGLDELRYRPLDFAKMRAQSEHGLEACAARLKRDEAKNRAEDQPHPRAQFRQKTQPLAMHLHAARSICVEDAFVKYPQAKEFVLRGADLKVSDGSIHALVGGNGSGKTTMLYTVAKILKPKRGKATNQLHDNQAFLPQNPKALFLRDTVAEELAEWSSEADAAPWPELFELAGTERKHPLDLSGGQQQLLALAKTLATEPALLLLDEPTKGLDPEAKLKVAHALLAAKSHGTTIVLATHDLAFSLAVADSVSMLFDGQTACTEPPERFFAQNLFYKPLACRFTDLWARSSSTAAPDSAAEAPRPAAASAAAPNANADSHHPCTSATAYKDRPC